MFTDLEGFTSQAQTDEAGALHLLDVQEELFGPILAAHRGRKIKSIGDGLLLEFPNARDAVECGVDLQRILHEHNAGEGREPLRLRVGIHLGDVEERGNDILGDAVNIASRIEPLSQVGGVAFSAQVFDQVRNKVPYQLEKLGSKSLKGVREPIDVYRVVLPWANALPAPSGPSPRRLAVLPFAIISPDPKDEYFADGLTEELITVLSQFHELQVIARTSVIQYKTTPKPVPLIGAELGVSSILEGSVRKSGDQLRITVQLIEVGPQGHTWASSYDRKLDDIFAVQTDVANQIAKALRIKVGATEQRRLEARPTPQLDSYLAYLKGRTLLSRWSEDAFRGAIKQFELALSIDSTNARAHSGLSDAIRFLAWGGYEEPKAEWWKQSRVHAARAIELDPTLAEAHNSLGLALWDDYEWAGAEEELKEALSLNPSYAPARTIYATVLQDEARPEEALRELELAEELDPQSTIIVQDHARLLACLRRPDEISALCERLRKQAPDSFLYHSANGWYHYARSDFSKALEAWSRAEEIERDEWRTYPKEGIYALLGEQEKAAKLLEEAERKGPRFARPVRVAEGYALLGEFDESFRILFRMAAGHGLPLQFIRNEPAFEPLRSDPRFDELLRKVNLA